MSNLPTLLMTFAKKDPANSAGEAEKIWKTVENNPLFSPKKVENATIDDLADAVFDSQNLFMFHFGGHTEGREVVPNGMENVDKIRLSRILQLNDPHNLQLVFLNGNLSSGHVGLLTAKGVKAVIATNSPIDDAKSGRVANFFYRYFFEKGSTLKSAFESAEAMVDGKNSFPTIVNPGEFDETQTLPATWTLFVHAAHTEVLGWKLADFVSKKGGSPAIEIPATSPKKAANPILKRDLQNLVATGQMKDAMELYATNYTGDQTILMLQAQLADLERSERLSIISHADANLQRAKITNSSLSLFSELG